MKATAFLKKQHRKVEGLFEKLEKGRGDASSVLNELADDLTAHAAIEQSVLYPAAREIDPEMVDESYQEHAIAELALKRLLATEPDDVTFKAKLTALKEVVEHHIEEEEDQLFPEIEKKMDADELDSLSDELQASFVEASEMGYRALLPEGLAASGDRTSEEFSAPSPRRTAGRGARRGARRRAGH